jgi:hypothetical protein
MAEQERLTPVDWERVWKRVELYAFRITGQPYVSDDSDQAEYVIGQGVSAKDLASQVLHDFLTGGIPPDPAKDLNELYLVSLLKSVVKKRFVDLLRQLERRKTDYAEEITEQSEEGQNADFFDRHEVKKTVGFKRHQMLSDPLPAPDAENQDRKYRESLKALYEHVKDDESLREIMRAICEEELETPREIATYLGTSREDIYNRLKKLRRRFKHLQQRRTRRKAI